MDQQQWLQWLQPWTGAPPKDIEAEAQLDAVDN